jgi:hypothetical protein
MRTVFEDTTERENLEDAKANESGKQLTIGLWIFAVLFFFGSWSVYYWAANRKPPEPPPPPVSLQDAKQVSETINKFNRFAQEGNWDEAQKMLSTEAQQWLTTEGKSLRASLLGDRENDRVMEAATTPSGSITENTVRLDCVYKFLDGQYKIIPLVVVKEGERLAINSW